MSPELTEFKANRDSSPFLIGHGKCEYDLHGFLSSLLHTCNREARKDLDDWSAVSGVNNIELASKVILSSVPKFQRDNDKWSIEKQQLFLLNVLMGHKTELTFYRLGSIGSCSILDGLQRTTSLLKLFREPEFLIPTSHAMTSFVKAGDLIKDEALLRKTTVIFKRYEFNSELEAVDFYISSNRGFTHSEDDIKRALDYRERLLAS